MASLPACVGAAMIAVAVGVLTSLLLEDAAASAALTAVEFGCDGAGAMSALALANWLRFFWAA